MGHTESYDAGWLIEDNFTLVSLNQRS